MCMLDSHSKEKTVYDYIFLAPAEGCILLLQQWGPAGPPKDTTEFNQF